VQLLQK